MHLSPRNYDRLQDFVHQSYAPVLGSLRSFLGLTPGSAVVEIGCGTGMLAQKCVAAGYRYTGVEPDAERARTAQERCPEARIIVSAGEALDLGALADAKRAFIHGVLHHMDDDQCRTTLQKLMSVRGMRLMVIEPFLPSNPVLHPLGYVLAKADEGKFVRPRAGYEALCKPWLVSSEVRSLKPRWPVPFVHLGLQAAD